MWRRRCGPTLALCALLLPAAAGAWKPPGMSERAAERAEAHSAHAPGEATDHHDHTGNLDVEDLVMDTEHLQDDLGDLFTMEQLDKMKTDEIVFNWFKAHDGDEDEQLDGLELVKALGHEHNFHHEAAALEDDETHHSEDPEAMLEDAMHDPAQHTAAAERQRFRRVEKAVDKILEEDDSNYDGYLSFGEFMTAFQLGKLDKVNIKKEA